MTFVFLDGAFVQAEEATIPVQNRGFLFGDGVYATIRIQDGVPLFLSLHLERLRNQAKSFGLLPPPIEESAVLALIEKNKAFDGIWKLKVIVTAGEEGEMRLPERRAKHLLFLLHPFEVAPYKPLHMALYPFPVMTTHTSFKSLAHLSRYFVMEHGIQKGAEDAVTTTSEGFLLEASFGNLFWVYGKKLATPSPALPLHFGVTIGQVVDMAHTLGYGVEMVKKRIEEIPEGASLFRANTMSGLRPIERIEDHLFARNPSLEALLLESYEERTRKESPVIF